MATTKAERKRFAAWMRKHPTKTERILANRLRKLNKEPSSHFQQQVLKCRYILDFWFPTSRIAVEVDGPYHQSKSQQAYDSRRDLRLAKANIETLRFTDKQIIESVGKVADIINARTKERYVSKPITAKRKRKIKRKKRKRKQRQEKRTQAILRRMMERLTEDESCL